MPSGPARQPVAAQRRLAAPPDGVYRGGQSWPARRTRGGVRHDRAGSTASLHADGPDGRAGGPAPRNAARRGPRGPAPRAWVGNVAGTQSLSLVSASTWNTISAPSLIVTW